MKNKPSLNILLALFLSIVLVSFQNNSNSKKAIIDTAQSWFTSSIQNQADFELDWSKASVEKESGNNGRVVIDVPSSSNKTHFNVSKTKNNIVNINNSNSTRRIVIVKDVNGAYSARVLNISADDSYRNGNGNIHRTLRFNPYEFLKKKFTGSVWFEDLQGNFLEGLVMTDGKKSHDLRIARITSIADRPLTERLCTTYEVWLNGYYNNGTANVVAIYLEFTSCSNTSYSGGSNSWYGDYTGFNTGSQTGGNNNGWTYGTTDDNGCISSCMNAKSKSSCFISWVEPFRGIEYKRVSTYISAYLSDCKFGNVDAKTYSVGENATIVDTDTQLDVTHRQRLNACSWRVTLTSRPKVLWQPTSIEIKLIIAEKGLEVGYIESLKYGECGPVDVHLDLGQ